MAVTSLFDSGHQPPAQLETSFPGNIRIDPNPSEGFAFGRHL